MRIALLHFAYCGNKQSENQQKILQGMEIAAKYGAQWVLTPEMALQGYQMMREDFSFQLASRDNNILAPFEEAAKKYKQRLFLGCGFVENRVPHNSCVIINPDGTYCDQHAKVNVVKWITEEWAHPGDSFLVWNLDGIRTSVMVCADMYYAEHGVMVAQQGAELIIGIACWPEGGHSGPPQVAWERLSKAAGSIPLIVVNQTGVKWMDCSSARSAVVEEGALKFYHNGDEAVLLIEFDAERKMINSKSFMIVPLNLD